MNTHQALRQMIVPTSKILVPVILLVLVTGTIVKLLNVWKTEQTLLNNAGVHQHVNRSSAESTVKVLSHEGRNGSSSSDVEDLNGDSIQQTNPPNDSSDNRKDTPASIDPVYLPFTSTGNSLIDRAVVASLKEFPREVITWQGVTDMNRWISSYWKGNYFCDIFPPSEKQKGRRRMLNITFSCRELFARSDLGSGNFISVYYGIRLAARVMGDIDILMICPDAEEEKTNLLLPWMTGWFPAYIPESVVQANQTLPKVEDACGNYDRCPIGYMGKEMQFELRRMAVAMVGVVKDHPSVEFVKHYPAGVGKGDFDREIPQLRIPNQPIYPDVELDDVVLHFRCGDLMNSNHPSFGFMRFTSFTRHISPAAQSIGIVTQPFTKSALSRGDDVSGAKGERCRIVVLDFVDFLRENFPKAEVRVHNSLNETLALTYARMLMANQSIVAISSFGVFGGIGTFGTGYIRKPDYEKAPNKFLNNPPISNILDNVVLIDEPDRLMAYNIKGWWNEQDGSAKILAWFRNEVKNETILQKSSPPPTTTSPVSTPPTSDIVIQNLSALNVNLSSGFPFASTGNRMIDRAVVASLKEFPREIITWQGVNDMNRWISSYWKGNYFCDIFPPSAKQPGRRRMLNITFSCRELFARSDLGSGNFISVYYGIRLAARVMGDIDILMICPDAEEEKTNLLLPWMTGWFPAYRPESGNATLPSVEDACGNYDRCPIGYMGKEMQFELRRMAVAMVGVVKDHPSVEFVKHYPAGVGKGDFDREIPQLRVPDQPIYPDVELDDVILHFRCGDLMNSRHPSFGFMRFTSFTRHISHEAQSIGIVTQPFAPTSLTRRGDVGGGKGERCRIVVLDFVDFLKEKFPNADVRVHNSPNETLALTYARMLMANQTIIAISSFGVFGGIGTFGTGYIRKPDYAKAPNKFLNQPPISSIVDNVVLIDEPDRLMAGDISGMWQAQDAASQILAWFRNETYLPKA